MATAIKSPNIRAVVSYEPGSNFVFPEGEVPAPIDSSAGPLDAAGVPLSEFMALTKIPVIIYYGDYIRRDHQRIRGRMAGGCDWRWQGYGRML